MYFINHSGGAEGSDYYWGKSGEAYNTQSINYSFKGHKPKTDNVKVLTEEELSEADSHLITANFKLNRRFPAKNEYVTNLLRRNWYQVKNAKAIFAIGKLDIKKGIVDGGTGWAVQMAIDNKKDVYVFNVEDDTWYKSIYGERQISFMGIERKFKNFAPCKTPILTKEFAGIGTRELTLEGKKAIDSVYKETYKFYMEIKKIKEFFDNQVKIPYNIKSVEDYDEMIITIKK